MQLQQLIRDIRAGNPKFGSEETDRAYSDRIYHLALMAWERTPESEKEPDTLPPVLEFAPIIAPGQPSAADQAVAESKPLDPALKG